MPLMFILPCQRLPWNTSKLSNSFHPATQRNAVRKAKAAAKPSPEEAARMTDAMDAAMKDPQVAQQMAAMQEAIKRPEAQQQMQQMAAAMQNQQLQQRMATLKDDPDLAPMFEDIQKNGMQALMKYWNDPNTLAKIGERLGDVEAAVAPGAAASTGPLAPEINTLLDAAKYGDLEAVQDFLAIGKNVNEQDGEGRSPLHYAIAYSHADVVGELLEAGADPEARDSKGNTALHYATGYGRSRLVRRLLEAGSKAAVENGAGQLPLDLISSEPRNPINKDKETLAMLEHAMMHHMEHEGV